MTSPSVRWCCSPTGGPMSTGSPARRSLTTAAASPQVRQRKLAPPLRAGSPNRPGAGSGLLLPVVSSPLIWLLLCEFSSSGQRWRLHLQGRPGGLIMVRFLVVLVAGDLAGGLSRPRANRPSRAAG
jgi:hypothetical protein